MGYGTARIRGSVDRERAAPVPAWHIPLWLLVKPAAALHLCFCATGAFHFNSVLREQKMDTGSSLVMLRKTTGKITRHIRNSLWILRFPGRHQISRNDASLLPTVVFLKKNSNTFLFEILPYGRDSWTAHCSLPKGRAWHTLRSRLWEGNKTKQPLH